MAADGSVIIDVNMNTSKADKELAKLKKEIENLEKDIEGQQEKRSPLVSRTRELRQEMEKARAAVKKYGEDWVNGVAGADGQQTRALEHLSQIESEYAKVSEEVKTIDKKLKDSYDNMEELQTKAGTLQQNINQAANSTRKMEKATKRANKHMGIFATRLRGILLSAFVFNIMSRGFRELTDWMGNVIKSNDEARASIAKLKGALLTLAQPLVNVVVPAFARFVDLLTAIVARIGAVFTSLFGTTWEEANQSAEALYNEQNAIEGVGDAADAAKKSLAGFDEINRLTSNAASSSSAMDTIAPNFAGSGGLISALTFTLNDILFKWNNLTAEDILSKLVTALSAIAGGIIGFAIGGVGGAVIGIAVGAGLGITLSNVLFDGDGKLSGEELLRSLVVALGAIAGGIIGFSAGGVLGAAIGVTVGASIGLALSNLIFDGDGKMSDEEILKTIVVALGAIAGGVLGFAVGGVGGAAIGVMVGAGLAVTISKCVFNGDGQMDTGEILDMVVAALTVIGGGIIGFSVGGPLGALIGMTVGAGVVLVVSALSTETDGETSALKQKLLKMLEDTLWIIAGGVIGFAFGGPGGAVLGMVVAGALRIMLGSSTIEAGNYKKGFEDFTRDVNGGFDALGTNVSERFDSLASDAAERSFGAGAYTGAGFSKGLEQETSALDSWVKTHICDTILGQIISSFGIHSPSTVMAELGYFVMAGFQQGISNNIVPTLELVKSIFNQIMTFINTVFFAQWNFAWQNVAVCFKNVWNGIVTNLENAINLIIRGFNLLIAKLNSFRIEIPPIPILGFGGYSFGLSIPMLSGIAIPRLAEGAVIPPNREFLAVLGDQKSGTNIETPLETMVQAFRMALSDMGGGQNEAVMVVDDEVFARLIYKLNGQESKRIGVSFSGG